jgi:hypothetical protein
LCRCIECPTHAASCTGVCEPTVGSGDVEAGTDDKSPTQKNLRHGMWAVMTEAFTLTFLAEWGDRSQIATIALAAAKDPFGGMHPPAADPPLLLFLRVTTLCCGCHSVPLKHLRRSTLGHTVLIRSHTPCGLSSGLPSSSPACLLCYAAVTLGGIIGHSLCTGLAVIGGRLLASRLSEKTVAFSGGILFFLFAIHSLFTGPEV